MTTTFAALAPADVGPDVFWSIFEADDMIVESKCPEDLGNALSAAIARRWELYTILQRVDGRGWNKERVLEDILRKITELISQRRAIPVPLARVRER